MAKINAISTLTELADGLQRVISRGLDSTSKEAIEFRMRLLGLRPYKSPLLNELKSLSHERDVVKESCTRLAVQYGFLFQDSWGSHHADDAVHFLDEILSAAHERECLPLTALVLATDSKPFQKWDMEKVRAFIKDQASVAVSAGNSASVGTVANAESEFVFRRDGAAWEIIFSGSGLPMVEDYLGLSYLQLLLSRPGKPISAAALVATVKPSPASDSLSVEHAAADTDLVVTGFDRENLEKIRKAVSKSIKDAIDRIEMLGQLPAKRMATHLRESLTFGHNLKYQPHPPIVWKIN